MNKYIEGKRGFINALINDVMNMKLEQELIEKPFVHVLNGKESIEATFLDIMQDKGMEQDRINVIFLALLVYNKLVDKNFEEEVNKRVEAVLNKDFNASETMGPFVKAMLHLENDVNLVIIEEKQIVDYDRIFDFLNEYMNATYQAILNEQSEQNSDIDKNSFVKED